AWRCSVSMSRRDFLRLENRADVPDHSWLSKTRGRLPREVHGRVFGWVLKLVAGRGTTEKLLAETGYRLRFLIRGGTPALVPPPWRGSEPFTAPAGVPLGLIAEVG